MATSDLENRLEVAREYIAQGDIERGLEWLHIAKHVAVNTQTYFPAETITAILESAKLKGDVGAAYRRLVEKELSTAKDRARRGCLDYALKHIEQAREYADPGEIELSRETIKLIFETAYQTNIVERLERLGRAKHGVAVSAPTLEKIGELARQDCRTAAEAYFGKLSG